MGNFRRIISITTSIGFYLASTTSYAALPPLSLSQMYSYAQSGNVRALRAATQRGMNIDITDRNGDTALCYAIKKNDKTAYNALKASGANPRHGCTMSMPRQQYESFMNSYGVAGIDETPRKAYNQFNDGEFIISKKTWIIGGVVLAAGIGAAFAFGGGGGGGGGGNKGPSYTPTNDNLGDFAGQKKPDSAPSGFISIIKKSFGGTTLVNSDIMNLNNNNSVNVDGSLKDLVEVINFNDKMLEYAKYIQVAMKSYENSSVSNMSTINLGDVTAGLISLGQGSSALNKNLIQINAKNGTLGMIASDFGQATNDDRILISFGGTSANHQVVGMYADTGGIAKNDDTIETISSNATAGTLIGMQGRIINQEVNPSSSVSTKLINSATGKINLSNTSSGTTNAANLIGMGSFIDSDFLNGTKLVGRAGFVDLTNLGEIKLKSTLIGDASYTSNIRENTGGIIGMRADANSVATNEGSGVITVEVEANDDTKFNGSHAGMLSVHGGSLNNKGNITVTGGTAGYGMIAIRGTGSNSEFDNRKPTLISSGNINMDSIDGFGMISFHGGTITNSGNITFTSNGTGIHSNAGTITNSGTITMNNGGKGITVIKNPAGEGSANYDTTNTKVINTGSININKSGDKSYGIYVEYGTLNNIGNVNMANTLSSITGTTYGLYADKGTVNNSGTVFVNINNVSAAGAGNSYGIYSENANINNLATGAINFTLDGVGIYSVAGNVNNAGTITMANGGIGIMTEKGNINNSGTITMNNGDGSVGISTITGTVKNTNKVIVNADNAYGIYSVTGDRAGIIYNGTATDFANAEIRMTGKNIVGINVEGNGQVYNYGTININSNVDGSFNGGIITTGTTTVDNYGAINLIGNPVYLSGNQATGIATESGTINNNGNINIRGFYGHGIVTKSGIINNTANITLANAGIGIDGSAGSSSVNKGIISITGSSLDDISHGMKTTDGTARNDATITIDDEKSSGIWATGTTGQGVNNGTINIEGVSSSGLIVDGADSIITNTITGIVNINDEKGIGMHVKAGKAYNQGTINLNGSKGIGILVESGSAINSGKISYTGTAGDIIGMTTTGTGTTLTNAATGKIEIKNGLGMSVSGTGLAAINNGEITSAFGMYALAGSTITNNSTGTISATDTGMYASGADSKAYNYGTISSTSVGAYGMYTDVGGLAVNEGTIDLNANGVTGMSADGVDSKAVNKGTIRLTGSDVVGMYATNGASISNEGSIIITDVNSIGMEAIGIDGGDPATEDDDVISRIYNTGTITIDGNNCNGGNCGGNFIKLGTKAEFVNGGLTYSTHAINFDEMTNGGQGKVMIADGGSFEAPDISGKVYADSSIVKDSFDKYYTNENSFIGNSEDLDLESYSFMFEASLVENEDGNQDVVMTMKDFDEVVSDKSMSDYLSNSYDELGEREDTSDAAGQNANKIFNALKSANNQNGFNRTLNNQLGLDFFPSLAHQNLEIIKSLDRQINNSLFANTDPREVTAMFGYDFVTKDQERSGAVQGYEENANSVYALVEKRHNNNFSYGAGFSLTKLDSKYDNGSKRDDVMINLLAPLKYRADSYTFVSVPRVGYGWGDYNRRAGSDTYNADTKNYYYGITNEARKDIDLGLFILEPTAEFNILGVYQAKTKETRQITVDSTNNISAEAGLGLYAKKSVEFDEDNKLKIRAGATLYKEFGDYDNAKASMFGLSGNYNVKGYERDNSRGVISGRLDYTHKTINFYTEASRTIERDNSYDIRAGVEFRF